MGRSQASWWQMNHRGGCYHFPSAGWLSIIHQGPLVIKTPLLCSKPTLLNYMRTCLQRHLVNICHSFISSTNAWAFALISFCVSLDKLLDLPEPRCGTKVPVAYVLGRCNGRMDVKLQNVWGTVKLGVLKKVRVDLEKQVWAPAFMLLCIPTWHVPWHFQ